MVFILATGAMAWPAPSRQQSTGRERTRWLPVWLAAGGEQPGVAGGGRRIVDGRVDLRSAPDIADEGDVPANRGVDRLVAAGQDDGSEDLQFDPDVCAAARGAGLNRRQDVGVELRVDREPVRIEPRRQPSPAGPKRRSARVARSWW